MTTVKYRGELVPLVGKTEERVQAGTVNDVMKYLKKNYSAQAYKEARKMLIVVNGDSILLLQAFKTPVGESDTVTFLPVCGGG